MDFSIGSSHPTLEGHFPGRPVVPGVVVLEQVVRLLESLHGPHQSIRQLKTCKFLEPLLPDEKASLHVEAQGASFAFTVTRDGVLIAKGVFAAGAPISS